MASVTDTRVDGVERNVGDLREEIQAIDKKVDRGFAEFGRELRVAVQTLTTQIGGQQTTKWAPILSALALALSVLTFVGKQALDPVTDRVHTIEGRLAESDRRAYEEQRRTIDRLRDDIRALRKP